MGERLLCKQEVIGSIPFTSTTDAAARLRHERQPCALRTARASGAGSGDIAAVDDREGPSLPPGFIGLAGDVLFPQGGAGCVV